MRQAKVNPKVKLRLIGDVFADRGNNDYLTLKVLEKLHTSGVSPEIIYSNHDATLLYNYNQEISNWVLTMRSGQQRSMQGLLQYIKGGKIDQEEVKKMIAAYVMPNLKLISYSLSEDKTKTALFMHAPNSFKAIEKMAGKFDAQDGLKNSAIELAARIDKINGSFRLWCDKQLSEMLGTTDGMVNQFVWNRLEDTE